MSDLATANSAAPAVAESDSAAPSDALDTSNDWDFQELDEDQANPEPQPAETETDRETDEAPDGQEADSETEQADETESSHQAELQADKDGSVSITLPGGEKATLKELIAGNMRDRDYRHKTTELANQRREIAAKSSRIDQTVNALSELLMAQVPPAPDQSLSITDPLAYVQQKAQHESGMSVLNDILQKAAAVKEVQSSLTQEQQTDIVRSELAKLEEAFPQTRTEQGRRQFAAEAVAAAKEFGITDQELQGLTDHRQLAIAYYASLGLKAEKAKATASKKVEKLPQVPPQKARGPNGAAASKARASQDAMKRLGQTGSIHDAMMVDFD